MECISLSLWINHKNRLLSSEQYYSSLFWQYKSNDLKISTKLWTTTLLFCYKFTLKVTGIEEENFTCELKAYKSYIYLTVNHLDS